MVFVTGHRGSPQEAPENTIKGIELAIAQGADYVELDIQQTKDGKLVVCHDVNLKRLTGVEQNLWELSFKDLQTLEVGSWFSREFAGEKIPSLEQVLALTKGRIKLNLELKVQGCQSNLPRELVKLLKEDFDGVISSFNYPTLIEVKQLNDRLSIGLIMASLVDNLPLFEVDFYSVTTKLITTDLITQAHNHGLEVHVWTVNQVEEIQEMIALGVDNIISDHPKIVKLIKQQNDKSYGSSNYSRKN